MGEPIGTLQRHIMTSSTASRKQYKRVSLTAWAKPSSLHQSLVTIKMKAVVEFDKELFTKIEVSAKNS